MKRNCIICFNKIFSNLFIINRYKIIQCQNCGLITLNPMPNIRLLRSYYKNFKYDLGFLNEKIIRKDAISLINMLDKFYPNRGKLIDVGCGAGFLLDEARKKGWEVQGIDFSKLACAYARETLKLNVINHDFISYKFKKRYNVSVLIQVIEHLVDPVSWLKKIRSLLEPNGIIIIATPNITSFLAKILKENFNYLIPPEHVYYFSPVTLSKLLESVGFEIIKIKTYGYESDLSAIVKKIYRNKFRKINKQCGMDQYQNKKSNFWRDIRMWLFERVFCHCAYQLLNVHQGGSMIELYARKVGDD